ncbi:MAG: FecR domain-containing protein [Mucilaginibacter sp.]|nr:FecR domain-containing protein [Mucilaginibacter sp.]
MQQKDLQKLLERYANGNASDEEKALLESWYLQHAPEVSDIPPTQLEEDQQRSKRLLALVIHSGRRTRLWPSLAIAASILLVVSVAAYLSVAPKSTHLLLVKHQPRKHDFLPGGNKATLTLAGGQVIMLDGAQDGKLASQGNITVSKTGDGTISYAVGKNADEISHQDIYNTAATPRGGEYRFILADGSRVWLNAQSSLKFPVNFSGKERKVELTGEAYFEVVHDASKPFRVVSNGQVVEDLGTHFNINAYSTENTVKTTLLEGSIRVSAGGKGRLIIPGEMSEIKDGVIKVSAVDVEDAIAWKKGYFHFNDNTIQEVSQQLARWYDVDIEFEGTPTSRLFSGDIPKNLTASQMIDILSFKKVHYRLEDKKIIIMP